MQKRGKPPIPPTLVVFSLHFCGSEEAEKYKWIESQRAGFDLGDAAIREWIRRHWNGFLRERWLQHIEGTKYWIELRYEDFGLLRSEFTDSELIRPIISLLRHGWENLDIIREAIEQKWDRDEVYRILNRLDINSRRMELQFRCQCCLSA